MDEVTATGAVLPEGYVLELDSIAVNYEKELGKVHVPSEIVYEDFGETVFNEKTEKIVEALSIYNEDNYATRAAIRDAMDIVNNPYSSIENVKSLENSMRVKSFLEMSSVEHFQQRFNRCLKARKTVYLNEIVVTSLVDAKEVNKAAVGSMLIANGVVGWENELLESINRFAKPEKLVKIYQGVYSSV